MPQLMPDYSFSKSPSDLIHLLKALARPIPAPQTAREMASYGGTDMDRGRCAILKMAAQITIIEKRLVDTIVLEGMGLPTAGVDSRSKSPTDPTALAVRQ